MSTKIQDTAETVKGIVEAVPIYEDLAQPAVKEIGIGLQTIAKTIHIALAPISALIWGYDKIKDYVSSSLEKRLKNVPEERIITPNPIIAGPSLEALRFVGHNEELRELYANLISTSMDSKTVINAHPSFVEILKQLSPDEARILSYFTFQGKSYPLITIYGVDDSSEVRAYKIYLKNFSTLADKASCDYPQLICSYIDNLTRLGLVDISYTKYVPTDDIYDEFFQHSTFIEITKTIKLHNKTVDIRKGSLIVTTLGEQFYKACISNVEHD
ncbi:DUF4393 domain-containing protein [Clostridium botulinum]|uniref:DUF4393 domain-containing protein n=1 Tax=Clostridium botulinum TaxID=1491 RepID=UPI000774A523|nr:DUF4393 domain-containing protein [Clostridium botulinum]